MFYWNIEWNINILEWILIDSFENMLYGGVVVSVLASKSIYREIEGTSLGTVVALDEIYWTWT